MACINGTKLSGELRAEVLSAYGYRWTVENEARARQWHAASGLLPPTIPLVTDGAWLADHAFHVTKGGQLHRGRRFAQPACMADDWTPEGEEPAATKTPVS